ncbi:MAG: hypothetical protein F6K19_03440 [Cyanothece sp. SIO1E1]|nr:hypothetical protein [Cyanothece sp. SIO1E1]
MLVASNLGPDDVLAVKQQLNKGGIVKQGGTPLSVIEAKTEDEIPLQKGDLVEVLEGQFYGRQVYVDHPPDPLTGDQGGDQVVQVTHPDWYVKKKYPRSQLRLLQRGGQD